MANSDVYNLSPLDGRYKKRVEALGNYFSEAALISYRLKIEVLYLIELSKQKIIRKLSLAEKKKLKQLLQLNPHEIDQIKKIEAQTHHDVKAVEYFIRQQLAKSSLADLQPYVHFGLTSEDINNLAYRLMVKDALESEIKPTLKKVLIEINQLSDRYGDLPMLARTHGQPAIPTTFGKECAVFASRLLTRLQKLDELKLTGKLNGAVGGYQALVFAKPKVNWLKFSREFIEDLGLVHNPITTQVNPADDLVEVFNNLALINSILVDLSQDFWRYISDDWLIQKGKEKFVGSSTMPHKINPIEFENAEGNLQLANSLFELFSRKLPVSRLQRDLSDSTVMRNIGTSFGYSLLAYQSLIQGLSKLAVNKVVMTEVLEKNYAILTEAWQTLARTQGDNLAYEKAAVASKNKNLSQQEWQKLTQEIDPRLADLTPQTYLGYSAKLAKQVSKEIKNYLKKGKS